MVMVAAKLVLTPGRSPPVIGSSTACHRLPPLVIGRHRPAAMGRSGGGATRSALPLREADLWHECGPPPCVSRSDTTAQQRALTKIDAAAHAICTRLPDRLYSGSCRLLLTSLGHGLNQHLRWLCPGDRPTPVEHKQRHALYLHGTPLSVLVRRRLLTGATGL